MYKAHKMEKKDQKNLLLMAVAGIGLYLFFKKKSAIAPVVPPTTGGGGELQPIAPSPVIVAPVQPIYTPSEPITPSPISALPVLTNPISDIISLIPVQQTPPAPVQPIAPSPIYSPVEPIYEAPVYRKPEPIYSEPIVSVPVELPQFRSPIMDVISPILPSLPVEPTPPPMEYFPIDIPTPSPSPIYWEPSPVFYEPTPVYQPEPTPVYQLEPIIVGNPPQIAPIDEPLPPSAYIEEYKSITDPYNYLNPSNYIPETFTGGGGGLSDFINNLVWLGTLNSFQAESYLAVDTITKDQSDQA